MAVGVLGILTRLAALPVGAALHVVHRVRTGRKAVINVEIEAETDLRRWQGVLYRLVRVTRDPLVSAVVIHLRHSPGSWAACQDLRRVISEIVDSGTPVYVFVESPGNALVWIASAADRVFMPPSGEVALLGVGAELTFVGNALARLGVRPDFEAAGEYKSFGEMFTRSFASGPNQEALGMLIEDLQRSLVEGIAQGRGLEMAAVEAFVDQGPMSAQEARDAGLVDELAYIDQVEEWLEERHDTPKQVSFFSWARRDRTREWVSSWGGGTGRIAVLHLQGAVVMEDPRSGVATRIAARDVMGAVRDLRTNDTVKAVVLHVNSGGGSALASDLMWREIDELQRTKPVVAAFADVAASGGYYLAAPATEILARSTTLTGSIGVFGGKLVLAEGLRKLGVTTHMITRSPHAMMYSPSRRFTEAQRERFRSMLERCYDGFVQRVATGRRRAVDAVEPECRGRVWTGSTAQARGLVDRTGDLFDAVERARLLAGLHVDEFRRVDLTPRVTSLAGEVTDLLRRRLRPVGVSIVDVLADRAPWLPAGVRAQVELVLEHPGEPLAMLPFHVDIR